MDEEFKIKKYRVVLSNGSFLENVHSVSMIRNMSNFIIIRNLNTKKEENEFIFNINHVISIGDGVELEEANQGSSKIVDNIKEYGVEEHLRDIEENLYIIKNLLENEN